MAAHVYILANRPNGAIYVGSTILGTVPRTLITVCVRQLMPYLVI